MDKVSERNQKIKMICKLTSSMIIKRILKFPVATDDYTEGIQEA